MSSREEILKGLKEIRKKRQTTSKEEILKGLNDIRERRQITLTEETSKETVGSKKVSTPQTIQQKMDELWEEEKQTTKHGGAGRSFVDNSEIIQQQNPKTLTIAGKEYKVADSALPNQIMLTDEQRKEIEKNAPLSVDKVKSGLGKIKNTAEHILGSGITGAMKGAEGIAQGIIGTGGNFLEKINRDYIPDIDVKNMTKENQQEMINQLVYGKPTETSEKIKETTQELAGLNLVDEAKEKLDKKTNSLYGKYNPKVLNVPVSDIVSEGARMFALSPAGLPGFMTSAAGGNMSEAINEGEELENAVRYGAISGAIEGGTEKMFDTFNILGGGVIDKFLPKSAIGKFITGSLGEGVEEVISESVNPFVKMSTYKGEVTNPLSSKEEFSNYINGIKDAGWQGFVMGMFMQGIHDVSDADVRAQYKAEVSNAVEKIKGLTEDQKKQMVDELINVSETSPIQLSELENYMNQYKNTSEYSKYISKVENLSNDVTIKDTKLSQLEKLIPMQKNDVPQSSQNTLNNIGNQIIPTEMQTAQNGNMEQTAQSDKVMDTLIGRKSENVNNIAKNDVLSYTKDRGGINGTVQFEGILGNDNKSSGVYEENQSQQTQKYTRTEYERFEKSIRPVTEGRITEQERELVKRYKDKYNKEIIIFDEKENNGFIGGASLVDKNKIYIDINSANEFGYNMLASHEVMESDILHNQEIKKDIIDNIVQKIMEDPNFEQQKLEFWSGQEGDIPPDYLIAKDIICDRFAELDNNEALSYKNVLSQETNMTLDYGIKNFRDEINNQNIQADNESAFSMPKNYIDPSKDIDKAKEFINKATIEDIDTLNKMVEEAEKHPDKIDLQFFAKEARKVIEKLSRQQVRQAIIEETELENYNLDDITKLSKLKMNFTTPIRVVEKVFNKETANRINENFFKPIKHNEAEKIRRLNKERTEIKELDIKPGSAEDAAIQKYGEGEYINEAGETVTYTLDNLKKDFPETWQKLQQATNIIRNKYDTYLEEINEVLKDNGYDPIPKRKDYFRHFEELNDLFSVLGVPTKVDDIPTDLNGMTADLKPGKQFFTNALQRKGKKTTYSAIKGIDGYLDGAMNILYHTKDIQNLRTLDKYIRDTYGQSKGLESANEMTVKEKEQRIKQINEGHLSEFVAWLTEYTNALAGKKSRLDRGIEELFGRKAYKYLNLIKKQVGANMTGLNVNSALSNFISLTQAAPKTNKKALIKGTIDTVKNIFNKDDFINKSDFLTTRFGSDKLAKNWWQKAGDAGQIFMSGTDYFTANLITRSKYQEFLGKGYTETEAIKKADEFADRLMAGRGKGDLPNAFESKMFGIVSQFQLEVANQLDSIFYDTLHEDYAAESNSKLAQEHPKFYNAASATFILGQMFALAFLYNEGKEELTGTEGGALDPIGTIRDAIKYLTDENLSKSEAIAMIVEDIANQLPFASIITGGGRIPIKEAFPDLLSVAKGEAKLNDELWNLTNLLLPTGGGQIKKTTQGLSTYAQGGSYSKDSEGKTRLKYPVEQTPSNLIKSLLFGKWSTKEAKTYVDNGFKALTAKQTEGYEKAKKQDITYDVFLKAYNAQKNVEGDKDSKGKTISLSASKNKKKAIDELLPGYTQKQKQTLYEAFGISEKVWKK